LIEPIDPLSVPRFLGENLHFLMQRYLTRSWPRPTGILTAFIDSASETLSTFSTHSDTPVSKSAFLEIGAGRDLAIALKLLGAKQVTAVDIRRLGKLDLVNHAAAVLADPLGMEAAPRAEQSSPKSSSDAPKAWGLTGKRGSTESFLVGSDMSGYQTLSED
jgi:hypothetical protein